MGDRVIEILNSDERACRLMQRFETAAVEAGMIGSEYEEARKTVLMMAIAGNTEAMAIMADEVYEEVNA
ncbi:hypothetical protein P4H71_25995 [Paenibacillus kribbensis]|uniref:hypothetical protein n=1 Tax=Paenibacillus kribbensis TaxID=172713 RepID=UPI002DBE3C4B|nr:hypothetical protein [Paenibacillus kribbensis]MEC0237773.1 hypothetical protein [Paenibacillus kribbensis]